MFRITIGFLFVMCIGMAARAQQPAPDASSPGRDIDNLPKPSAAVEATVSKTYFDSKPGKVTIPTAAKGAPNVVIFMIDDMGFGALETFGGPVPSPRSEERR